MNLVKNNNAKNSQAVVLWSVFHIFDSQNYTSMTTSCSFNRATYHLRCYLFIVRHLRYKFIFGLGPIFEDAMVAGK